MKRANSLMLNEEDVFPLPEIAWRILKLTTEPDGSDPDKLIVVISKDQALTTRTLKTANASLSSPSVVVSNVSEAAAIIGNRRLRALAVTASLEGVMNGTAFGKAIWDHSLQVASVSKSLAELWNYDCPENAYVAGLLHDVGKSLIDQNMPRFYESALHLITEFGKPFLLAEQELLGHDHTDIGTKAAVRWNLPTHLKEVIQKHHNLSETSADPSLCAIVSVANSAFPLLPLKKGRHTVDPVALSLLKKTQEEVVAAISAGGLDRLSRC